MRCSCLCHYCCNSCGHPYCRFRKWSIDLQFDDADLHEFDLQEFDAVDSQIEDGLLEMVDESLLLSKAQAVVSMSVEKMHEKSSSERMTTKEHEEKKTFVITGENGDETER